MGTPTSVQEYAYKQKGWKDQLVEFNGDKCEYDVLGNPTVYRGRTLTWQGRRILSLVHNSNYANFTYDANGVRTSKTTHIVNGKTNIDSVSNYIYDGNNLIAEQRNKEWMYFIYGVDGVAGFKYKEKTYLYRKNVQGDITHVYKLLQDKPLELVAEYAYDAWGNCQIVLDNADKIGLINPFRYRSYYFDEETDLYYLQTRYYDPSTCRFISADSIEYLDPETLGGLNLFAYCGNNPVMAIDPEGTFLFLWTILTVAAIGAVIGGVFGAAKTALSGGDFKECLGAFVGGAIIGGIMGAAAALGGGFGTGVLVASTANIIGAITLVSAVSFVGGVGAYYAENSIAGKSTTLNEALLCGGITIIQGLTNFGLGIALGASGNWESLKPGNGIKNMWDVSKSIYSQEFIRPGISCLMNALAGFVYENIGAMIIRTFIRQIFTFPWNFLKP